MQDKRVIFMGTPDFAVPVLEMLTEKTNVVLVVSQPDKLVGRHHELQHPPVVDVAIKKGIEVYQPEKISNSYEYILNFKPDLIVTCAYGQIIPEDILNCPLYGCVNVHASLLPKLRGGAPIHHAIIDGYKETGVTIMYMDKKMDTGDIISMQSCPILESDNVGSLHDKLSILGTNLLADTLELLFSGNVKRIKQNDEEATYAWNIKREEEHIDFNKSAEEVRNQVRGLYPWPSAYTVINGVEVKVLECEIGEEDSPLSPGTISCITKDAFGICTKTKLVYLKKIKPFGKKAMSIQDYCNGLKREKIINTIVE